MLYVKSFGGFIVDGGIITVQLKALQAALEADNLKFQQAYYFISSYDPPTRSAPPLGGLRSNVLQQLLTAVMTRDSAASHVQIGMLLVQC